MGQGSLCHLGSAYRPVTHQWSPASGQRRKGSPNRHGTAISRGSLQPWNKGCLQNKHSTARDWGLLTQGGGKQPQGTDGPASGTLVSSGYDTGKPEGSCRKAHTHSSLSPTTKVSEYFKGHFWFCQEQINASSYPQTRWRNSKAWENSQRAVLKRPTW